MLKNKINFRLLLAILLAIIVFSCQEDEILNHENGLELSQDNYELKMTQLGEKLENPYAIENMKRAYENLKKDKSKASALKGDAVVEIVSTHLYIRYKPKTESELDIIKKDTTLLLYDYPLDYEIESMGDYFHDPEVPLDQPTYQYTAISIDKEITTEVEYELLAELFIPDEETDDDINEKGNFYLSEDFINSLVDESLKITGNLKNEESQLAARRSLWRPAGRIRVWDDNFNGQTPVEGVKVRARRWFTTYTGITNSQGNFSCNGRFRRKANYSIVWERYHFEIRNSWLGRAKYNGPKIRGNWNLDIPDIERRIVWHGRKRVTIETRAQNFYATIFRATYHYYYKSIKGLRRPPQNSFWKTQLKIRAYDEENDEINGNHAAWRRFIGLGSAIKMYNPQNDSQDIYGTVTHELAHASHWNMDRSDFNDTKDKVKESWARGVQWELTRMVYPNYLGREFRTNDYTLVVSDMIDDDFITTEPATNDGYYMNPNDQVSGYTIRQIEDALLHQETWNSWRDNIISRFTNPTEQHLNRLFLAYEE